MENEKYQELLNDDSVTKFNEWGGIHFIHKNK